MTHLEINNFLVAPIYHFSTVLFTSGLVCMEASERVSNPLPI